MVLVAVGQMCSTSSMSGNLTQAQILVVKAVAAGAKVLLDLFDFQVSNFAGRKTSLAARSCEWLYYDDWILSEHSDFNKFKINASFLVSFSFNPFAHIPWQALFLPEASDYIGSSPEETRGLARHPSKSMFVLGLQKEARENNLCICVGIHEPGNWEHVDGKRKIKNTLIWIDETGKLRHRYQKIHLFDMDIEGGPSARESDLFEAGNFVEAPFQTLVGLVGMQICFDLRFPEPALSMKRQGAEIITYPSAFTVPTGKAHWELLLRARAIETEAYVIAAAQVGQHNAKRATYGHSMIVSPWGEIIAKLGGVFGGPEIAVADIDLDFVAKIRREVPLKRRTDVYPEL